MKKRDLCALAACLAAGASAPAQALPPQRLVIQLEASTQGGERESALALQSARAFVPDATYVRAAANSPRFARCTNDSTTGACATSLSLEPGSTCIRSK